MSQRTKTIIISIVICIVLAGVGVGLYCAWPAIVGTITGNAYYTYEDVQNAYNDGYTDGIRNEEELTAQIDYYKAEVDKYIESLAEAQIKIENLEKDLQDAINSGNADKETIAGLQEDLAEAQAEITAKQAQIAELQDDIKFYQELLEAYEDSGKLVVTFTLVDNGVETTHDVQVVEPNGYLTAVVDPTASDFEGWSLSKGGDLIEDLTTVQVTENMTVYGMFTNTVTFMVNGEEYATQEVSYNKYATDVEVALTGYNLDGWSLTENGEVITVSTTPITKDTTFYAVLKNDWDNVIFKNSPNIIAHMDIWTDGENTYYSSSSEQYVLNKETSTWEEKTWSGLTNFSGVYIWTDGESIYYSNDTEQYVLNKETSTWSEKIWEGLTNPNAVYIWTDSTNIYYSNGLYEQYQLNQETSTWEQKTWYGLTNFECAFIWTDNTNVFYSDDSKQYVLNKETSTWEQKIWYGFNPSSGLGIWTDGESIYYSSNTEQYVLNKETSTWSEKIWTGLTNPNALYIWTDGVNIYHTSLLNGTYILNT